ncbi:MAG: DUF5668 domain-containing protein [Candidatus Kapabacteria bacterium]|nr:DUF5668 domain-containing protein [Candidatus Kapabacteria bacterium]
MALSRTQVFGLLLIGAGVLLLLDALGIFPGEELLSRWWPLVVIALGIRLAVRRPEKLTTGLAVVALGCLLLASTIIPGFDLWTAAVPVLLIVIGIGILLRPIRPQKEGNTPSAFTRRSLSSDDELVNLAVVFGSFEQIVTSSHFRGGTVQAYFGSATLDLRPSTMATTEASLEVDVVFGSIQLLLPPSWNVLIEGTPLFGSIEHRATQSSSPTACILRVQANVVFGSIEIR